MKRIAILVSGKSQGTNAKAIISAVNNKQINARVCVVVAPASDAPAFSYALEHNIPTYVFSKTDDIVDFFTNKFPVDYIALAGWPRIIPKELIGRFPNAVLNIHPGLIPESESTAVKNPDGTDALWNQGKYLDKAIQKILDKKATYAGATLHFLTVDLDFGPVISNAFVKVDPNDTVESLYERIKKEENRLYIEGLQKLCG